MKDGAQFEQLKKAMEYIRELKIPDHLQAQALEHLLKGSAAPPSHVSDKGGDEKDSSEKERATTQGLRDFINEKNPKAAVAEIPALLYWAKKYENKTTANESDIIELYRRANIRPPRNLTQSLRDLASKKKYGRLEAVEGGTGHVRLSRSGEDFVIHDLKPKAK